MREQARENETYNTIHGKFKAVSGTSCDKCDFYNLNCTDAPVCETGSTSVVFKRLSNETETVNRGVLPLT